MSEDREDNQLPPMSEPGEGAAPESSHVFPHIEGYEIKARLGEGGMGTRPHDGQASPARGVRLTVSRTAAAVWTIALNQCEHRVSLE